MARTKQQARKETGGTRAPRKSHASEKKAPTIKDVSEDSESSLEESSNEDQPQETHLSTKKQVKASDDDASSDVDEEAIRCY